MDFIKSFEVLQTGLKKIDSDLLSILGLEANRMHYALRIFLVNVTTFAGNCRFGQIY